MVLTRAQRRKLQEIIDEAVENEIVLVKKKRESKTSAQSSTIEECNTISSRSVGDAVVENFVDSVREHDGNTIIRNLDMGHTMTYNLSSDFVTADVMDDNNESNSPPGGDSSKCTCYFLNFRNSVDLQNISDAIRSDGFSWRFKFICGIVSCVLAIMIYLGYRSNSVNISEIVQEQSSNCNFWTRLYAYLQHLFLA